MLLKCSGQRNYSNGYVIRVAGLGFEKALIAQLFKILEEKTIRMKIIETGKNIPIIEFCEKNSILTDGYFLFNIEDFSSEINYIRFEA